LPCLISQSAIHIQAWLTFLKTNDHNSSNSRIVADSSFASGLMSVSLKGGNSDAFFYPLWDCVAWNFKRSLKTSQTTTLLIGSQYLFFTFIRITMRRWIFPIGPFACTTEVSLLSVGCTSVAHQFITFTVRAQKGDAGQFFSPASEFWWSYFTTSTLSYPLPAHPVP
jgi:hypothetical protein